MVLIAIPVLLIIYGAYCVFIFWHAAQKSAPLVKATPPFNLNDPARTTNILVLGDSLAVGVGAPAERTIAGRFAAALNANVDNFAKSGAQTKDIQGQLAAAQKSQYDLILIQVGANDIIQLKSLSKAQINMDTVLAEARKKSDRVVFLIAGNVGDAPLWPLPWGYIFTKRTLALQEKYKTLAELHGAHYIDLYARGPIFSSDPDRYYANDKLHLTADGYEKWFNVIQEEIQARWPEFVR